MAKTLSKRYSGVLAHPTSFPSPYGIGDFGKGAYDFINFLTGAGTIQPIKKSAANVAMNKKNAPFPSATQSEYKQMIDFLEERPEKTPTAEAAKSEEKSE